MIYLELFLDLRVGCFVFVYAYAAIPNSYCLSPRLVDR